MPNKTAFIYTDDVVKFSYGPAHPLKPFRLRLTQELVNAYGLLSLPDTRLVKPERASDEDLLSFHDKDYIEMLKASNSGVLVPDASYYGLGPGDNPVFRGLFDWSVLVTGGSLLAASLVDSGEVAAAFNISGGLHHAKVSRASGFCYVNDPVVSIQSLLRRGRRVAYVDIDAHHGDGVQDAFYKTDKVLTISIHETGRMLFPGTGYENEIGEQEGEGYCVNVPMPPYLDDELFVHAFSEIVPPLIERFRPDVLVTQLGVDSFRSDPLAHLNYTTNGFCEAIRTFKALVPKWVALGGGGYDISNVARAWTLAWGIMNGVEVPDDIPAEFLRIHADEGFQSGKIRDEQYSERDARKERMRQEVERVVRYLKKTVFTKVRSRKNASPA